MFGNWIYSKRTKDIHTDITTKKEKYNISLKVLKEKFSNTSDIRFSIIEFFHETVHLVYLNHIVDSNSIDVSILKGILEEERYDDKTSVFDKLEKGKLPHISLNFRDNLDDIITDILSGNLCIIDPKNKKKAVSLFVGKVEKRAITEPSNENIIKGSKEAFIENMNVNLGLIRNRIRSTNLKINKVTVGNMVPTEIAVIYMDNIVDKNVLEEVFKRLKKIDTNKLISVTDVEEQIIDNKYSIFPQLIFTEKVDKLASNIMDGKIALIIDGVPVTYILPAVFNMFLQAPEDYSTNYAISSLLRSLRYLCIAITLVFPSLYVTICTFHQELIPTELAISIIKSKQGEPFPVFVEVIFMLLAFEILIEASTRLPKTIGQTISIVGGLIIGEAAVNADIVSPAVVVVIAITGIAGFLMPNQDFSNALRISRFGLVVISGITGLYGFSLSLIMMFYYLSTIEVFGVPYFVPFSSNEGNNLFNDTIFRIPISLKRKKESSKGNVL